RLKRSDDHHRSQHGRDDPPAAPGKAGLQGDGRRRGFESGICGYDRSGFLWERRYAVRVLRAGNFSSDITYNKEETDMGLVLPNAYDPRMDVRTTQEAIKYIRDTFQKELGK